MATNAQFSGQTCLSSHSGSIAGLWQNFDKSLKITSKSQFILNSDTWDLRRALILNAREIKCVILCKFSSCGVILRVVRGVFILVGQRTTSLKAFTCEMHDPHLLVCWHRHRTRLLLSFGTLSIRVKLWRNCFSWDQSGHHHPKYKLAHWEWIKIVHILPWPS